jgi:hypothetical protein
VVAPVEGVVRAGAGCAAGDDEGVRNLFVALVTVLVLAGIAMLNPTGVPVEVRDLLGFGPSRLEDPPEVPGSGSFRFMQHQPGQPRVPVAYDPCQPIRVEINTEGTDDEHRARGIVLYAMREVSRATGLRLTYVGASTDRPSPGAPSRTVFGKAEPVLVAFADSEEVPELKGRVAGIGGSTSIRRSGWSVYVSGRVTLDSGTVNWLFRQRGGTGLARAIAMHELAHLVGLAHVPDESELMNPENGGRLDFGPGDLRGLALLGRGRCA